MKATLARVWLLFASLAATPAVSAPYAWILSSDYPAGEVVAIDVETDQIAARIPNAATFLEVEAAPGRRYAYASNGERLLLIDTTALAPVASLPGFRTFRLHPTREEAYTTPATDFPEAPPSPWSVYSTQTFAVVGQLPSEILADKPVAFDIANSKGYFATFVNGGHAVVEVDLATRTRLRTFPLPGPGGYGDLDAQARRLYVPVPRSSANAPLRHVLVFDLATGLALTPIDVGASPGMSRLNPARTRLYVGHAAGDSAAMTAFDTTTRLPVASIATGFMWSFNLTPAGDKVYAVGFNDVSVLDSDLRTRRVIPMPFRFARAGPQFIGGMAVAGDTGPGPATGLWWNPAEPGWGMHITHRRSTFFGVLFHYDANRLARWYVAPSCVPNVPCPDCVNNVICQGTVYETNGPAFFHVPFNPAAVQTREAGLMELQFADRDNATATFVIAGQQRRVPIRRQVFAPRPTLATDYTDLWWNPLESGWGLGITQQSNVMFLTWFVYDEAGRPSWLVASNCAVNAAGNGCRGALYRTAGPLGPVPGPAGFDAAALRVTDVGTVEVAFDGANNGTISWTVDGRSGSRTITRQVF